MIVYMPCKLGETFEKLIFERWEDGKRIYRSGGNVILKGFFAADFQTQCLSNPTYICSTGNFLSFDPTGEFGQEFAPKYKLMLDLKSAFKLCDKGFPGSRRVSLCGICISNTNVLQAEFVTLDRYEHLYYPIKPEFVRYVPIEEADVISEVVPK